MSFIQAFIKNFALISLAFRQHVLISFTAILAGVVVAIPFGIFLTNHKKIASVVLTIFGVVNTIPSIVLLGVAMMVLGLGFLRL